MQHRSFIFVAAFVAALIVGAVGAYAYDSSRDDKIANGVTVAGVDVGGLNAQQARREVSREVSEPLQRPVVVTAPGKRFTLSADDAGCGPTWAGWSTAPWTRAATATSSAG